MKTLHVGEWYGHDPQSMGKVKDNVLELDSRRCRSQALSLSLKYLRQAIGSREHLLHHSGFDDARRILGPMSLMEYRMCAH
jgi:hypothetical protein